MHEMPDNLQVFFFMKQDVRGISFTKVMASRILGRGLGFQSAASLAAVRGSTTELRNDGVIDVRTVVCEKSPLGRLQLRWI